MIGIIVMMIYKNLPDSFIETSFCHNVIHIWLTPSNGLFLNRMVFESYNNIRDIPEKICFDENEEKKILEFREKLLDGILTEKQFDQVYQEWIQDVSNDKYSIEDDCGSIHGDY
ncbi:tRNA pseudouridine synthase family protein, putative [Ichthyophthirius multifiliis]|uniref:tRNA pseudouridine synthase family protein, putative n=1 Tax=Ichthyophthirius multifiliis TaxID=5932 RepID=G0QLS2_ICHMU|nr:tRNA pseudouridine synthase family protein, putative [Ichthyophthirius multifiliis]EGR33831.1 tRNA pseudouridine synthase family protein, putative [Ichthyophthirius multifiliis]|eukprot:XP_004039055.1 tRNA pseudouridine synthase family protein, putative [Ichthyophthirius multifiliis]